MSHELTVFDGLTEGQTAMLTQITPAHLIRQRKGRGGKTFNYVPHEHVTKLLNEAFGHCWSFEVEVLELFCNNQEVTVRGKLIVPSPHGLIVKEAFGSQEYLNGGMTHGDALKGAQSDALRKAASLLGIALDLYGSTSQETNGHTQNQNGHKNGNVRSGNRNGKRSDDPVTTFWTFINDHGLDGKSILQEAQGVFEDALDLAQAQYTISSR